MSLPKTSIPERRTSGQLKPRKLKPNDNPLLVAIASFLGFSGLTTYSILTGNIAYFSLVLRSSGGVEGWLLRIFIILVSFLSTLTGLGVIFIPRQTLAALRLMGLAGLGSLVAGLLLSFLGIELWVLAGTATVCFWGSAIATYFIRQQRRAAAGERERG